MTAIRAEQFQRRLRNSTAFFPKTAAHLMAPLSMRLLVWGDQSFAPPLVEKPVEVEVDKRNNAHGC